jgi:hypothetical protein
MGAFGIESAEGFFMHGRCRSDQRVYWGPKRLPGDCVGPYRIEQELILADDGEILAEPLFWFRVDDFRYACIGNEILGPHARQ